MKKIITISREFGAAGSTIGLAVAEKIGFEFYDKELILQAAKSSNVDADTLLKWDEKIPVNFGFAQSLFDFYNRPLGEKIYHAQTEVIRKIGEKGRCVIVGRNADNILKEYDNSLHVFIYGEQNWRLMRMQEKMPDVPRTKLLEQLNAIDKARKKYCAYYTRREFGAAENYDLCLNASSLGIDRCVEILCGIVGKE